MANILVTGGAGYIGNVISNMSLKNGHNVRVVDTLWFDRDIPLVNKDNPNYEFIEGDICDAGLVDRLLENIDFVVHTAAVVGEPATKKFPELTRKINYQASRDLIDRAEAIGIKVFIFLSTCSNYGIAEGIASEDTSLKPLSPYAETKVDVEKYIMEKGCSIDWVICRLSTVYGTSPRMRFDLTVNDFTLNAYTKKFLDIFLPYTYRPYIHVSDVANAITNIVDKFDTVKNNVFNIGFQGENHQKIQIAEAVKKYVPDVKIELTDKGTDVRDYKVDFSKFKSYLGLSQKFTGEDGVKGVIDMLDRNIINDPSEKKYYNTTPDIGALG